MAVTIDATFVRFVHTQSLDIRIWCGRPAAWPRAGASAGVARVALRSLLTTLGGVGGNVSIAPRAGDDRHAAGHIAVRLFFKHRGLSSSSVEPDAGPERQLRHQDPQGEKHGAEGKPTEAGELAAHLAAQGGGRDRAVILQKEGVVCDERADGDRRGDSDTRGGAKFLERDASLASTKLPEAGGLMAGSGAAPEECREAKEKRAILQRWAPDAGGGGKLQVVVERAMRLPLLLSGTEGTGAGLSVESLPSTYVTFRWEEGGRPPLRSPFAVGFGEAAGEEAEVECSGGQAWRVSFCFSCCCSRAG